MLQQFCTAVLMIFMLHVLHACSNFATNHIRTDKQGGPGVALADRYVEQEGEERSAMQCVNTKMSDSRKESGLHFNNCEITKAGCRISKSVH